MVVNIASLPSTLTVLGGAVRVRGRGAGARAAGEPGDCTCAGTGDGACAAAGKTNAKHNPTSTVGNRSIFMPFAAVLTPTSRLCYCRVTRITECLAISRAVLALSPIHGILPS